jgi:membrane-anchored glycerophosphoryl diester phosphodiesterase (GDPDase)
MANYTIIGGDGKQYGPITGDDLRKWISEGRLNAQSLAKADSDAEFRPLSTFPELSDAFAPQAAMPDAPPLAGSADWLERDYELDIGDCVSRGWKLFKENMGTFLGAFIVAMLLAIVGISIINAVLMLLAPKAILASPVLRQFFNVALQAGVAFVMAPLLGGLYYIFIQRMRGRPATAGDVFIGFQKAFAQLFLGQFVVGFFVGICMIPFNIAQVAKVEPLLEQMRHASSPADVQSIMPQMWAAIFGTLPVLLVCMIPVTYLTVNWVFTLPLVIDRQMKFWPAMMASWKKVHQHWWLLLGFTVVIGLLNLAGICACCVGVLFTAPIGIAATMYAYETIFGESQTR